MSLPKTTIAAFLRTAAGLLLGLVLCTFWQPALAEPAGGCAESVDRQVPFPYAIQATWMFTRETPCEWQQALEAFHRLGGRVVMQFAPALQRLRPEALDDCRDSEGRRCIEGTLQDLAARGIGAERIAHWLVHESPEPYGEAITCPGDSLDRRLELRRGGSRVTAWRIVLQHDRGRPGCALAGGRVSVLFVVPTAGSRGQPALLQLADALGMEVFLGAPAFPVRPQAAWRVDDELAPALLDWSERVFRDFGRRYGRHASFKGVYQSFEVALEPGAVDHGVPLYREQAARLHAALPGRQYLVSPYFYVNRRQRGTDLAGTVEGFRRLARAGVDVIMPQDGRGTGKAALYWPWQRQLPVAQVDPQLARFAHVDGRASMADQFAASTAELFDALQRSAAELARQESITVELWPNIEAFEEDVRDPAFVACGASGLSQTTKARLDRAITFAGPARRIVSFMFDPLFTCRERLGTTLADAIAADHDRPLLVQAALEAGGAQPAIVVAGHHLLAPGSRFEIMGEDGRAQPRAVAVSVRQPERGSAGAPDRVRLEFDRAIVGLVRRLSVVAIAPDGRRAHEALGIEMPRLVQSLSR